MFSCHGEFMQKASKEVDPILDVEGVVSRFHEWGMDDVSERYVRHLWESGMLSSKVFKRKRRTSQSTVDAFIKRVAATK
jgi:hypothetical protein